MAKITTAAVFSDHMVLQRNKNISIFGYSDSEVVVTAALFDNKGSLLSRNSARSFNGRWDVQLEPQVAQEGCRLTVSGPSRASGTADTSSQTAVTQIAEFSDISIGEVWIAGGQSNMEFELQNCTEGPEELANEKEPSVRFYYTNKIAWKDDHYYEAERNTCWQTWESDGKKAWSAVGYFFAKKLAKDLGCTVGIIGCNWGGTSASCWMKKEYLEKDSDLNTYLTEYEEATRGKTVEQQCREYEDYEKDFAKWNEKYSELWQKNHNISWDEAQKIIGTNPWPGPKSCKNPFRPAGLYDCMLSRIMPYTVKGVIWYQGESDDHKPTMYAKLFSTMIDNWRSDWHDDSLPFVFVQLPVNRYEPDKDYKHWPLVREAQTKVHNTVKNAWMISAMDLGVFNDIHPKHKKELAQRMENNALCNVYHMAEEAKVMAPIMKDVFIRAPKESQKGTITISFNNADSGFEVRDDSEKLENYKKAEAIQGTPLPEDFTGFEVAGRDGVYYPAEFAFGGSDGKLNTITLCSKKVREPVFARYCWYNYGPVTIYGKNGLPLAPFRTSTADGKATGEHAAIQQIMEL